MGPPSRTSLLRCAPFGTRRGRRRSGTEGRSERGEGGVERGARAHHGVGLGLVDVVVAADVGRLALYGEQLGRDGGLLVGEGLGQPGEQRRGLGVVALLGQRLRPVERKVEVARPGCRSDRPCGPGSGSPPAPGRWPGPASGRAARPARCRSSPRGTRTTPPARGTPRGCPSAGSPPSPAAGRAWARSPRRRSRTGRRRPSAARSRASWRTVPSSRIGNRSVR